MIGFRLQLKKLPDGRLVLTIPIGYKLLLLFIGLLILISLIVTRDEGGGSIFIRENTIPLIIAVISLLGAAYHERWIFDKSAGQAIHQNGLIVIHSNKVYRLDDIDRVEISQFGNVKFGNSRTKKRSINNRSRLTLSLHMKDGISYRVEMYRISQKRHVERTASIISEYCRIPFVIV
jgi:hypothetical protein